MILFFILIGVSSAANSKFFPSPDKIKCSAPFVMEVHHHDAALDFRKGVYGEQCLDRILRIYEGIKGNTVVRRLKVKNGPSGSDQGFDSLIIDHAACLVIFLEAKSRAFELLFDTKKEQELSDQILGNKSHETTAINRLQHRMQSLLKQKPADQLSRKWCEICVEKVEDVRELAILKKAMNQDRYEFIRLVSLTTGITAGTNTINRAVTYYALVRDADSKTQSTADPIERARITDAALTHVLEKREKGNTAAEQYCSEMFELLKRQKLPIEFLSNNLRETLAPMQVVLPILQNSRQTNQPMVPPVSLLSASLIPSPVTGLPTVFSSAPVPLVSAQRNSVRPEAVHSARQNYDHEIISSSTDTEVFDASSPDSEESTEEQIEERRDDEHKTRKRNGFFSVMKIPDLYVLARGGTKAEKEKAFNELLARAKKGAVTAMDSVSKCYKKGYGCNQDSIKSEYWINKTTEIPSSSDSGESTPSVLSSDSEESIKEKIGRKRARCPDYDLSGKRDKKTRPSNLPKGLTELYSLARDGRTQEQRKTAFLELLNRAKDEDRTGYKTAMDMVYKCYKNGYGCNRSERWSDYWFEKRENAF